MQHNEENRNYYTSLGHDFILFVIAHYGKSNEHLLKGEGILELLTLQPTINNLFERKYGRNKPIVFFTIRALLSSQIITEPKKKK